MQNVTLNKQIEHIHRQVSSHVGDIGRIGVALYNADNDMLSTFIHSTDGKAPLEHYQAYLSDVPSLKELAESHQSRVLDDLSALAGSRSLHTRRILAAGYKSSYTAPLYSRNKLLGFLFFDSPHPAYFKQHINIRLDTYAELIANLISTEFVSVHILKGVVTMAREFGRHRDNETGCHVMRVAHVSKIIARELASSHDMSDEEVEFLFQFAGLHDIGKIAVPDNILLKPDTLTSDEFETAKTHVTIGKEIFDVMVREFEFDSVHNIQMLHNIISCHHECYDGSGYPAGLKSTDIPLEGRILKAADVFDALTSMRPYKAAMALGDGLQYLLDHAGIQFDPDCVEAMVKHFDEIKTVYGQFAATSEQGVVSKFAGAEQLAS